jgi:hypothetical protein
MNERRINYFSEVRKNKSSENKRNIILKKSFAFKILQAMGNVR